MFGEEDGDDEQTQVLKDGFMTATLYRKEGEVFVEIGEIPDITPPEFGVLSPDGDELIIPDLQKLEPVTITFKGISRRRWWSHASDHEFSFEKGCCRLCGMSAIDIEKRGLDGFVWHCPFWKASRRIHRILKKRARK